MKLKTLIKKLKDVQKEQGNINVVIDGGYWDEDCDPGYKYLAPVVDKNKVEKVGIFYADNSIYSEKTYKTLVLNKYESGETK